MTTDTDLEALHGGVCEPAIDGLAKPVECLFAVAAKCGDAGGSVDGHKRFRVVVSEHAPLGLEGFDEERLGLVVAILPGPP